MPIVLLLLLSPAQVTLMADTTIVQSQGTSGAAELTVLPGVSVHSRAQRGAWFFETSAAVLGHTKREGTRRILVDTWALGLAGDAAFGYRFGDKVQLLVFVAPGFIAAVGESRLVVDGRTRGQGQSRLALRLGPGLEAGIGGYRIRVLLRGGYYDGGLGASSTFSVGYRF